MECENFVEQYFKDRPEFLKDIKVLEQSRDLRLLDNLFKDRNEINFYSWLSEMRFGLYFNEVCSEIIYDQCIDNKTPDWTIMMNNQKIIAEVLRLNTNEQELQKEIAKGKEIRKFQDENPNTPLVISSVPKILSSEYFYGAQHKLTNKELKYRVIISKYKLPFILCVESTINTFISELDVFDFLIANNKRGFFYRDKEFGRSITGVLFRTYFNELFYYPNDFAEHQLNQENLAFLCTMQYKRI